MLHREIMAVCSEIHTKHINTLCGQKVELLNGKLAVYKQCIGNHLLHFHGNTEHFYVADSHVSETYKRHVFHFHGNNCYTNVHECCVTEHS
jgi:hypothetical protein